LPHSSRPYFIGDLKAGPIIPGRYGGLCLRRDPWLFDTGGHGPNELIGKEKKGQGADVLIPGAVPDLRRFRVWTRPGGIRTTRLSGDTQAGAPNDRHSRLHAVRNRARGYQSTKLGTRPSGRLQFGGDPSTKAAHRPRWPYSGGQAVHDHRGKWSRANSRHPRTVQRFPASPASRPICLQSDGLGPARAALFLGGVSWPGNIEHWFGRRGPGRGLIPSSGFEPTGSPGSANTAPGPTAAAAGLIGITLAASHRRPSSLTVRRRPGGRGPGRRPRRTSRWPGRAVEEYLTRVSENTLPQQPGTRSNIP